MRDLNPGITAAAGKTSMRRKCNTNKKAVVRTGPPGGIEMGMLRVASSI
jgi:hypothetical protein